MRRREFIALLGGAAVAMWPFTAHAQQNRRISILHSGYPNRTPIQHLFAALRALGYEDGRNTRIELLGGEGDPERLAAYIAKLAAEKPDVIIALTEPAVLALKKADVTTPVVFAFVSDPVGRGIVKSLARPGGNFTGISFGGTALGGKRLELLLDLLPDTKHVAVIWNPSWRRLADRSSQKTPTQLTQRLLSKRTFGPSRCNRLGNDGIEHQHHQKYARYGQPDQLGRCALAHGY